MRLHPLGMQLLTTKEAATYLRISVRKLGDLTRLREIRPIRLGPRCHRYDVSDLDAFIDEHREEA